MLAECIRRDDPPFPIGKSRVDLAVTVLQLMYSLGDEFSVRAGPAKSCNVGVVRTSMLLCGLV